MTKCQHGARTTTTFGGQMPVERRSGPCCTLSTPDGGQTNGPATVRGPHPMSGLHPLDRTRSGRRTRSVMARRVQEVGTSRGRGSVRQPTRPGTGSPWCDGVHGLHEPRTPGNGGGAGWCCHDEPGRPHRRHARRQHERVSSSSGLLDADDIALVGDEIDEGSIAVASSVHGRVHRHQQQKCAAQDTPRPERHVGTGR